MPSRVDKVCQVFVNNIVPWMNKSYLEKPNCVKVIYSLLRYTDLQRGSDRSHSFLKLLYRTLQLSSTTLVTIGQFDNSMIEQDYDILYSYLLNTATT
jgi:hypothetical protein